MFLNESSKFGKPQVAEAGAKAPTAPRAYSAPKVVVLGQAHNLVQGSDLSKPVYEGNGYYFDE